MSCMHTYPQVAVWTGPTISHCFHQMRRIGEKVQVALLCSIWIDDFVNDLFASKSMNPQKPSIDGCPIKSCGHYTKSTKFQSLHSFPERLENLCFPPLFCPFCFSPLELPQSTLPLLFLSFALHTISLSFIYYAHTV